MFIFELLCYVNKISRIKSFFQPKRKYAVLVWFQFLLRAQEHAARK